MNTIDRRAYEGDIVSRLRHWRGLHLAHSGALFEEAAAEIERIFIHAEKQEAA
jgi:predicted methyltransferase MtxX (methanogen marker protein 4)